jgi:hypothetical protein
VKQSLSEATECEKLGRENAFEVELLPLQPHTSGPPTKFASSFAMLETADLSQDWRFSGVIDNMCLIFQSIAYIVLEASFANISLYMMQLRDQPKLVRKKISILLHKGNEGKLV